MAGSALITLGADAPKTVPSDMGVAPNYSLLTEYGFTPAADGTTRPDNTTLWETFTQGFGTFYVVSPKAEKTTTKPSKTNSETSRAKGKGPCDADYFAEGFDSDNQVTVLFCDGEWAQVGMGTGGFYNFRWTGSSWDRVRWDEFREESGF